MITQSIDDDGELILLSALAHYAYCPRRCGLIHVERIFQENVFTLRGRATHERTDQPVSRTETRREKTATGSNEYAVKIERALPLWSKQFGLTGTSDVVEFFADGQIAPVEYKPGALVQTKRNYPGEIQMCAQALCLEEMFGRPVLLGYIYSITSHRRQTIPLTEELRDETIAIIASVRRLIRATGALPPAVNDARCPNCSLNTLCVPETVERARQSYAARQLYRIETEPEYKGTIS